MESGKVITQLCIWTGVNEYSGENVLYSGSSSVHSADLSSDPSSSRPPPHTEVSGPVISVFLSSAGFYPLYCYNSDVEHPGKRRESEVEGSGSEDTKTMAQ